MYIINVMNLKGIMLLITDCQMPESFVREDMFHVFLNTGSTRWVVE